MISLRWRKGLLGAWLVGSLGATALGCADMTEPSETEALGSQVAALTGFAPDVEALVFDGVDDRVSVPNPSIYQLGSGAFSISLRARVEPGRAGGTVPFVSARTNQSNGFLFIGYGGRLLVQFAGVPNFWSSPVPELSDGNFHTYTVTREASGLLKFYVDGQDRGGFMAGTSQQAYTNRPLNAASMLTFGRDALDGVAMAGAMSEVRLYTRALPAAEAGANQGDAGLIGRFMLSDEHYQQITDLSPVENHAFLGATPEAEATDPGFGQSMGEEPVRIYLTENAPNRAARTTDSCGDVFVDGADDSISVQSVSTFEHEIKDWFCRDSMENLKKAVGFNLGLSLVISNTPIDLGIDYENDEEWQRMEHFCSDQTETLSTYEATSWVSSVASPVKVKAWLECMQVGGSAGNPVLRGSQELSQNKQNLTLKLRYNHVIPEMVRPTVLSIRAVGAICTQTPGGLAENTQLSVVDQLLGCTRSPDADTTITVATTHGVWIYSVAPALRGTAWAIGSVSREREVVGPEKFASLSVGSRTCLLGACKTTHHSTDIWADAGFKLRNCRAVRMFDNNDSSGSCDGLTENDTKVTVRMSRAKKHSARYDYFVEQYKRESYLEDVQSNTVTFTAGAPFVVEASSRVVGSRVVRVNLGDGRMYAQNLDTAVIPPFRQVSPPVQTGTTKYYTLVLDVE